MHSPRKDRFLPLALIAAALTGCASQRTAQCPCGEPKEAIAKKQTGAAIRDAQAASDEATVRVKFWRDEISLHQVTLSDMSRHPELSKGIERENELLLRAQVAYQQASLDSALADLRLRRLTDDAAGSMH